MRTELNYTIIWYSDNICEAEERLTPCLSGTQNVSSDFSLKSHQDLQRMFNLKYLIAYFRLFNGRFQICPYTTWTCNVIQTIPAFTEMTSSCALHISIYCTSPTTKHFVFGFHFRYEVSSLKLCLGAWTHFSLWLWCHACSSYVF